jgi:hypothetical protein
MIRELSWADYSALDAINPSLVSHGLRSMRHMLYAKENPTPPTRDMILGTVAHSMVFEPLRYIQTVRVFEGKQTKNTKATKAWKNFVAECQAANVIPLELDELAEVQEWADAVADTPHCAAMVGMKGITEACLTWTDETGLACKSRLDRYIPDGNVVLEFKTARDGSPDGVVRAARDYGWDIAAAMRIDGITKAIGKRSEYWWIVVEKEPPYVVTPYRCDEGMEALGRAKYRPVLEKWAACVKAGRFPGYADKGGLVLSPATWELMKFEVEYTNGGES